MIRLVMGTRLPRAGREGHVLALRVLSRARLKFWPLKTRAQTV